MLQHGADPDTYVEHRCKTREYVHWTYTALHAACRKGYADCVHLLLEAGAGPHLLDTWADSSNGEDTVRQPCVDLKVRGALRKGHTEGGSTMPILRWAAGQPWWYRCYRCPPDDKLRPVVYLVS
jgi:hypothetical protein